MKTKTKTKITYEKHERSTIRIVPRASTVKCAICSDETAMLTLTDAAIIANTTQMVILRCVKNGKLHFFVTDAGSLLICGNSLIRRNFKAKRVSLWDTGNEPFPPFITLSTPVGKQFPNLRDDISHVKYLPIALYADPILFS